jgi:hypothetical protein
MINDVLEKLAENKMATSFSLIRERTEREGDAEKGRGSEKWSK